MARLRLVAACVLACVAAAPSRAGAEDPLAVAFGTLPAMWNLRISPDGSRLLFLQMLHPKDLPIAAVLDLRSGKANLAAASVEDEFDLDWCNWANDERILCGLYGVVRQGFDLIPMTRVVAVNADGSDMRVLLQKHLSDEWTQFQDSVLDFLADDPRRILMAVPRNTPNLYGEAVARIDIYSGKLETVVRERDGIYGWLSDGRGTPRVRLYANDRWEEWEYRIPGDRRWHSLHRSDRKAQTSEFDPVGFGLDPDRLFVIKPHEGRLALWAEHLGKERKTELVFASPEVDVDAPYFLGKYRRMVAIEYATDIPHLHFFDEQVRKISEAISAQYPDQIVTVFDESWDQNRYLVHIASDRDSGTYYVFDVGSKLLVRIAEQYPQLRDQQLARMKPIRYAARDGVEIPAYLTLPPAAPETGLPVVIFPHGGPTARDYWGFDWIAQFLAAKGYAVLQSNYRGSAGYGESWIGEGAFRSWRLAIDDLTDGARHLIESGIADPKRICVVGWSYGGYAALQSAVVEPDLYRCAVAIAPVSDPWMWVEEMRKFTAHRAVREFVGTDDEVLKAGSPLGRAREIRAPILLFHGDEDINVSVDHSRKMAKVLEREKTPVEYVEYKQVDHQIARDRHRIDMLDRIGAFLERHLAAGAEAAAE